MTGGAAGAVPHANSWPGSLAGTVKTLLFGIFVSLVWLNRWFSSVGSPCGKRSLQLHHESAATADAPLLHRGEHHGYRYRQVVQR